MSIITAPVSKMEELKNLYIELSAKSCNQRCKHCYIDFPVSRNVKDFISVDKIKQAIADTKEQNLECIYLTGAEPMTHPEFNAILRICLKRADVCVCTNASFINEKKARFLKKVEEEGGNEIFFKLSIDHYNEIKNDDIRGRGSYRQTVNAIKSLIKYDFNPILSIVNYYREDEKTLLHEFKKVCEKIGFDTVLGNFEINNYYNKYSPQHGVVENVSEDIICKNSRILTEKGVYVCPFLTNDHRGRMGNSFSDYSKKMPLETNFCYICNQK
ncbi:MAG TPA: radical SAM protein [Candidatus Gastranaerophilaceae bacterium]|nr:radical SAM protein [Candidatus Gastranaerophilaceae bacterium]HPT41542.1 radical SAM protein [Candidatus Gastranaerophilaceae bacterium]